MLKKYLTNKTLISKSQQHSTQSVLKVKNVSSVEL